MTQTIEFNDFQSQIMAMPEELDMFLGGGRGGGKSFGLGLLCLRHVEQYGEQARILYLRRTYKGLADFELITRELFGMVYGTGARYNATEHVWRFPNGAYMELGQLESQADYTKYQGRSFTLLVVDEAGQYPSPEMLDMMRSNLRGPKGMPIRMIVAANPGGPGHHWIAKRYVFKAVPWSPFYEEKSKRQWVYAPSTFIGNRFIDTDQYKEQLESACPDDPELLRAWIDGDWAVNRGAYFASVLDDKRNLAGQWNEIPDDWAVWLAHDFGSSAPSATLVMAQSPGGEGPDGRYYSRGSIVVVDELVTNKRDNLNAGLGWTVPVLSEEIHKMCKHWGIDAQGVADDAIFSNHGNGGGSIADEFAREKVMFRPARKSDRITGWNVLKRLLADAGKPDRPGLYMSVLCEYLWETMPMLARDQKRVEDMDSTGPDHACDALRYGVLRRPVQRAKMRRIRGLG